MIVDVKGFGPIKFPDSMSEAEVRSVLKQFEPKKDDTIERLLQGIQELLKRQKPVIISEPKPFTVEKQVIVPHETIREIEKPVKSQPSAWRFEIEREDGEITAIYAEPVNG